MDSVTDAESSSLEVLVLEDDAHAVAALQEAVTVVAPDLKLRVVANREELEKALTPSAPPAAAPRYRLAILKGELLKGKEEVAPLLARIRAFRGKDDPETQVLLTTFEESEQAFPKWSLDFVFNLLHQPFDLELLKQHMRMALSVDKPSSESTVHKMQTNAVIEILKSIPMEALSEVGFLTRSDRPLPLKKVTKFYGKVFGWKNLLSVFARSFEERPHATAKGELNVFFTWFGTTREQLLQIRARFPKKGDLPLDWRAKAPDEAVRFLILGDPSPAGSELAGTLQRTFPKVSLYSFADVPDPKAALPASFSAIILQKDLLARVEADSRFKETPKILITTTVPTDEELRQFSVKAIDLLTLPTERVSFFKKISVLFPALKFEEDLHIRTFPWLENLDVGQPVELVEMSEASLTIHYDRALPIGTFRRFVLWQPLELGLPILTARCFLSQPDPSQAGKFLAHFVFFGMSDHEIKHVRLWMRDNYILAKSKNS